jgi:glycosyltransferase involved in cell wall biosynthesis
VPELELVVASNERPAELAELERVVPCRYVPFSLRGYARELRSCDVIVSPKRLVNGYELGHTEWKITLGMAAGLPAVASPQRSYVEAIEHRGGGIVADGAEEWRAALEQLRDPAVRAELGERARRAGGQLRELAGEQLPGLAAVADAPAGDGHGRTARPGCSGGERGRL